MSFNAEEIQRKIKYDFKDQGILKRAFTHKSYHGQDKQGNNERLEYLGDSLLGFIVAEHLFRKYKNCDEGKLTQEKQRLVSTKPLATVVRNLQLQEYIIQGESLDYEAGTNDRLLENLFEALIAALYLDGGLQVAIKFINENLLINSDKKIGKNEDYKSKLQVYTQSKKMGIPVYELIDKTGPEHNPRFTISVSVGGKRVAVGIGQNKGVASQDAARRAINKLFR